MDEQEVVREPEEHGRFVNIKRSIRPKFPTKVVLPDQIDDSCPGITWEDVYFEWLRWDKEAIQTNLEGIAIFERMARKNLANKAVYDGCQETIDNLKADIEALKKDMDYVRQKQSPRNQAGRNGLRYCLEENPSKNRNPGNTDN